VTKSWLPGLLPRLSGVYQSSSVCLTFDVASQIILSPPVLAAFFIQYHTSAALCLHFSIGSGSGMCLPCCWPFADVLLEQAPSPKKHRHREIMVPLPVRASTRPKARAIQVSRKSLLPYSKPCVAEPWSLLASPARVHLSPQLAPQRAYFTRTPVKSSPFQYSFHHNV